MWRIYAQGESQETALDGSGLSRFAFDRRRTLDRLEEESGRAIQQHRLYPLAVKQNEGIELTARQWRERSGLSLFCSKRAKQLAKLLRIHLVLASLGLSKGLSEPEWRQVLQSGPFRASVGQLIRAVKSTRRHQHDGHHGVWSNRSIQPPSRWETNLHVALQS